MNWRFINWRDPNAKISQYFTVREAIYLSKWGKLATDRDGLSDHVKERIVIMAAKMDMVRELIGQPIIVHRWFSPAGYNALVGGSRNSRHMSLGPWSAVDFHAQIGGSPDAEDSCKIIRAALLPKLEEWGLRMEKGTDGWVHLDDSPVGHARYFKP